MAIVKNSLNVPRTDPDFSPGTVSSREDDASSTSLAFSRDVNSDDGVSDADSGMGADEIDISEFGESGMEFCQVGNRSCSIPLELYDLTDLEGVLSLDTWNECLTEQERFALAQYLPDMEQDGFAQNLKELFCSKNFFFGNPAMNFFSMLRAGLCDPRLVLYRQCLSLFRHYHYYHMLKKYQNSMVKALLRMRNTWMSCDGYSIEQKVRVVNILRCQRDLPYSENGDLGFEPDSESGDSTEAHCSKRLIMVGSQARKSSQQVPIAVLSRGRSMALEPVRFGKEKGNGTLKVTAPKVCKNIKGNFFWAFDPGREKEANSLNGWGRGSVEELGSKSGGHCNWNAGRRTTMAMAGLMKSEEKHAFSKLYGRYMHNYFDEEGHERLAELSDYLGRGKNSDKGVTVTSFHWNPVNSAEKKKHSDSSLKYRAEDGIQLQSPKISKQDLSVHHNNLCMLDAQSIRGKKLKAGGHYISDTSKNGFDSKVSTYKISPGENKNGEQGFLADHRKKIVHCKPRKKLSCRQGVNKDCTRISSFNLLSEETESDSSYQGQKDGNKFPYASKSEFPSMTTKAKFGFVKLTNDPRKVIKTAKSSKKDHTHPVNVGMGGHTPNIEPYSNNVKQKSKTGYSSCLQNGKSAIMGQEVKLSEKLQPDFFSSYRSNRKRKGSVDLYCSQPVNDTCNLSSGILHEVEYNFDSETSLSNVLIQSNRPGNKHKELGDRMLECNHDESSYIPPMESVGKEEDRCLDEPSFLQFDLKRQIESVSTIKKKGKRKADTLDAPDLIIVSEQGASELELDTKIQKQFFNLIAPTIHTGFSFSIIHLLSAVRKALVSARIEGNLEISNHLKRDVTKTKAGDSKCLMEVPNGILLSHSHDHLESSILELGGQTTLPSLTIQEIVKCVRSNPGDPCILETQEPLQDLVRGALRIFTSRTAPLGAKGWKALVSYQKSTKRWGWVGPLSISSSDYENSEETFTENWCIPHRMLVKLVDAFANWLKSGQETLQQIGSLPAPPAMLPILDEKERFRDLKAQKSLNTIRVSSEEVRAYFRKEELLRYSIPDRAFQYTAVDGRKSIVAPLRRGGGKPTSKPRDHFMLKPDRPPHVTVLCLVRDSAARLPGSVGTRADVCTLIRDSQYIVEDVTDAQINQVVSGALDRLHYERDPCVQFDGDRKLWVYLHRDREDEDFEDDGTSSTKKWRRQRKDSTDNSDMAAVNDSNQHASEDPPTVASSGYDFHPDLNVDSLAVNIGDSCELLYNDLRPTEENFQSYINTAHSERGQDISISWELLGKHLRENKIICPENPVTEYYDDQSFSRDRTAGFLSGSLL